MEGVNHLYEPTEVTRTFFQFVTQEVVLAVVKSELGELQVEILLDWLTSWSVDALVRHMRIIVHSWGFKKGVE